MRHRLRRSLSKRTASAAARLRRSSRGTRPALRGCMQNVIIVKAPDPRFREAIFILRDDYFLSEELSRQELLLQAKEAAKSYVNSFALPRRRSPLLLLLLVLAVFGLAALYFGGLL